MLLLHLKQIVYDKTPPNLVDLTFRDEEEKGLFSNERRGGVTAEGTHDGLGQGFLWVIDGIREYVVDGGGGAENPPTVIISFAFPPPVLYFPLTLEY